jgi:rubrerythrin
MYDPSLDCKANVYAFCKNSNLYNRLREFSCKPEELTTLASKLNISEEYLLYFLHLCSMALDGNGKSLIDVRYHFFLRALEGAFVSLVNTNQLFLTRKEHISDITSPTVFEIALCKNCGDMAIVGKIRENPNQKYNTLVHAEKYDDDETFFQFSSETTIDSSEIDMDTDELLENIDTIDDDDDSTLKKGKDIQLYYLCPNCGAILCEEDGEPECGCGSGFIKIKSIHHTSNCLKCYGGKYDRFYLGNEAATAVMATSLFEELPSRTISKKNDEGIPIDREGGKQFLSFSDSRSEAAFFASYLDKSHKVFLRRRGLISLIKKQSQLMIEEPYTLSEVVNNLTKIFVKNKTFIDKLGFDEEINSKKLRTDCARNAWIAVLTELTSSRNKDSLQGLGYLKFEYRGNDARVVDYFAQRYSIPKDVCKALLDELIMSFAYFGAINVDDDVLETEDRKYIFFTAQQKYFTLVKTGDKNNRYHSGWCARNRDGQPDKYYSNMRLKLVCKTLRSFSSDFTESQANELLEEYFRYIKEKAAKENRILRGSGELYSLPADSIIIRVEGDENIKTFKCSKCGKITSTNINNQCPIINCDGTLKEYSLDSDRKNNHYIRLYENENLDALIVKEHTAQLSREEGLRYQQEFEKNQIHSLSCSTTFEMGVDVGDLETVLLRNVPPSAANYAQRAGRAGRSKHAAAFALTYAKLSSHDFHYFKRPAELIVGRINPPVFKTDNDKILLRHIFAVVLSYFFKHLGYFEENHARKFLEEDGLSALRRMLEEKPKELTDILIHSFGENLDTQFGISNYLWADMLVGESNGILTNIVMEHNITVQQLNNKINEFRSMKTTEGDRGAYIASNRLEFYREKKIIDSFARGNVLPRYGFPVDTVELDVNSKIDKVSEKKYLQLSRDLKLAIGEYAPGERVVANGKLYTSRYIKKSLQGGKQDFHRVWVNQCQNRGCESWNVDHTFVSDKEPPKDLRCQACGSPLAGANWYASIEPRGGFASDGREEEVPMKRPEKVYTNEATYIGEVKSSIKMELSTGSKELYLISTENDRILITSKTVFYVCNMCGYSLGVLDKQLLNGLRDSKKKPLKASEIKTMKDYLMGGRVKFLSGITHSNERGYSCGCDMLKRHRLNHSYLTDIVTVSLPNVRFERNALVSAMYAILDSMSSLLQIPRTDIDGCVIYSKEAKGYNIILFDAVSGGAGHVKRLIMDNGNTLIQVMRSAVVKMKSCDCDTSCYKCLRSYYNQRIHDTLNRNDAVAVLSEYAFGLKYIKKYKVEASEE